MLQCISRTGSLQAKGTLPAAMTLHDHTYNSNGSRWACDRLAGAAASPCQKNCGPQVAAEQNNFVTVLLTARQKASGQTDLDIIPDHGSAAL